MTLRVLDREIGDLLRLLVEVALLVGVRVRVGVLVRECVAPGVEEGFTCEGRGVGATGEGGGLVGRGLRGVDVGVG